MVEISTEGRRVVFRCIDTTQNHMDAKAAALLCLGGAVKCKLKAGHVDCIADDFLFTRCVPDIRCCCPSDRRLCRILGLAVLFACCNPTLCDALAECTVARSAAGLQGVNCESNAAERAPLHTNTVKGNLCVNEVQAPAQVSDGGGAGAVLAVPAGDRAGAVAGAGKRAILQSILSNQHVSKSVVALVQTQVDTGFAAMKPFMQ